MSTKIVESAEKWEDWANHGTVYVKNPNIRFHCYRDSIEIVDLKNALLKGNVCDAWSINWDSFKTKDQCGGLNFLSRNFEFSATKLLEYLHGISWAIDQWGSGSFVADEAWCVKIHHSPKDSKRVWTPFAPERIKPLKEMPKKWTIPHVVRALHNGQYSNLKCTGRYTDDYAFDAAMKFQVGELDGGPFAKRLIESPSGWRTYETRGVVTIDCHHFDNNEFTPVLNAGVGEHQEAA